MNELFVIHRRNELSYVVGLFHLIDTLVNIYILRLKNGYYIGDYYSSLINMGAITTTHKCF